MKFPSIYDLNEKLVATIRRFPLTMLAAFVAVVASIRANHLNRYLYDYYGEKGVEFYVQEFFVAVALTAVFGFFFSLAVDLFLESRKAKTEWKIFGRILVLGAVVAEYFYFFSTYPNWLERDFMTYMLMNVMAVLLV